MLAPRLVALCAFALLLALVAPASAPAAKIQVPIDEIAEVYRDVDGVPHIFARNQHDADFFLGWVHASDRLFQMDSSRRQASGTLAELLGSSALGSDVQLRTMGLRRAAQRSLDAVSPDTVEALGAYSEGVNAWLDAHPLPSEYDALELTSIPEWTPLDSMAVAKLLAFGLSFDIGDIANTQRLQAYGSAGASQGFSGLQLFRQDVNRSEPFAHAASIMPGETSGPLQTLAVTSARKATAPTYDSDTMVAAAKALENAKAAGIPTEPTDKGSNIWVVGPSKSASKKAMVANDPHLSLGSPSTFYELGIDITGADRVRLFGVSFPGTPGIVQGTNGFVSWGSTVNPTDVTDVYTDFIETDDNGVPVATNHASGSEPTVIIPQTYKSNQVGNGTDDDVVTVPSGGSIPAATVVVPRRNNGPIVSIQGAVGITVQYTGFGATRELDFFRLLARAENVGEAIDAQRFFDVGAQNWMYADNKGNIGYKTSAEIPLREDLQAGASSGPAPYFIRRGFSGNEWISDPTPDPDQGINYESLPFGEMDGLVNPARGWIANANQDPTGQTFDNDPLNELRPGGGIRYITPGHADGNRNTRISTRIQEALSSGDNKVSFAEMQSIQADTKLNDAKVLVPYIEQAFANAQDGGAPPALAALGADAQIADAVGRLSAWDYSTPTGIDEGYDPGEVDGVRTPPSASEMGDSVAATVYSLWRGQALAGIIDAPLVARGLGSFLPPGDQAMAGLRRLLEGSGTGASGIVFYSDEADRDTKLLQALRNALDRAASPAFAPAFGESTDLADYRWGYLHRITFSHTLGGPFSLPPGAGFTSVGPSLPGVATDGGFGVVDASSHNPRANSLNGFTFGSGPARRFVSEATFHPNAVEVTPGGASGNPAGPWFGNQLGRWLTNDYHVADVRSGPVKHAAASRQKYTP